MVTESVGEDGPTLEVGLTELPKVSESLPEDGPILEVGLTEVPKVSESMEKDGPGLEVGLTEVPKISESLQKDGPVLEVGLTEVPKVSESLQEDGLVLEVGLTDVPKDSESLEEDGPVLEVCLIEFPNVSESLPVAEPVLEVTCDSRLEQKHARTLLLVGRILGKRAFISKGRASGVTTACELQSSTLTNGQILNVIDTPGLFSLSPSTEFTCKEILRCFSLSKEGIDAVLLVFSLRNRLTEEEKSSLFALKVLFGSEIANYMIVVFTNEDSLDEDDSDTFEDYLDGCPDFKEIIEACSGRKVLFRNRSKAPESQKAKQVQELLNCVEEIARLNGKPYMSDLSLELRENEAAFKIKQKEVSEMKGWYSRLEVLLNKKDMERCFENEQLKHMMERVETQLRETKESLEQKLNAEQAARVELEKRAKESEKQASDVVKKLNDEQAARLELERRTKEAEEQSSDVVKKLNEEQAARVEMEKRATEVEKKSSGVVEKLKEELERANKLANDLQNSNKGWCIIL
ncbi:hypothetical protein CARUB_v10003913mg [Capsella rubella]|uniref:AIG1-type G domain-containing protein n=1 Tax=Capsella rubella TaxID=81985 RepID=R0GS90_9BRAS|nr:hypothetical protein CARUB_v10003913mg [Capsella rubella]